MGKNSMLSSQGSFLVAVDTEKANELDIIDLVRAEKEAEGVYSTTRYDFNNNGVTDEDDIKFIKQKLLKA